MRSSPILLPSLCPLVSSRRTAGAFDLATWVVPSVIAVMLASLCSCDGDDKRKPSGGGDTDMPRGTPVAADICDSSLESVASGDLLSGTTVAASNDMVAPCSPSAIGADVFYKLDLDEAAGVEVVVEGFDSAVYLAKAPCGASDSVAGACSDVPGNTEVLQVAELPAGEYFIAIDSLEIAGGGGPGAFTIAVRVAPSGVCADDALDRAGIGDSVATAVPLGNDDVDTVSSGSELRVCTGDVDLFTFGHAGGVLEASVTGASAKVFAAIPTRDQGELVIEDGEVVVDKGDWVADLPLESTLDAGLYVLEVSASNAPATGVDYDISLAHECASDASDHPLVELDDRAPETTPVTLSEIWEGPVAGRLCGDDIDGFLVFAPTAGDVVLDIAGGAGLDTHLTMFDPIVGTQTPVRTAETVSGSDLEIRSMSGGPSTFFLAIEEPEHDDVSYSLTAELVAGDACVLGDALVGESGSVTGSTLGRANRMDAGMPPLGPPSCTNGTTPGPDALFSIDVAEDEVLHLDLEASFDAALLVLGDCAADLACPVGVDADLRPGTNVETLVVAGMGMTYFVGVDSYDPMMRGLFTLAWEIEALELGGCGDGALDDGEECDDGVIPPQSDDGCSSTCTREIGFVCSVVGSACTPVAEIVGADTCDGTPVPLPLPAAGGATGLVVHPTLAGASDDLSGSCGGFSGPEVIYLFSPDQDATYSISAWGSDTILYAYVDACGSPQAEEVCNDDSPGNGGGGSTIEVVARHGHEYYVVLDFFGSAPGLTQVVVTRQAL